MKDLTIDGIRRFGNVLFVDLFYPRIEDSINTIELGLVDVRAADSIRINYDFERDGYVIKQASIFEWEMDDEICDADWKEVAFIQAWMRKEELKEEEAE